jgi:hypothetical protein
MLELEIIRFAVVMVVVVLVVVVVVDWVWLLFFFENYLRKICFTATL